jgi:hypothetical protein
MWGIEGAKSHGERLDNGRESVERDERGRDSLPCPSGARHPQVHNARKTCETATHFHIHSRDYRGVANG